MLKQILFVLFAVLVTALVSEYFAFKKQNAIEKKYRREIALLKRDKTELEQLKLSADQELTRAKMFIRDLEDWKKKAIQCSPEIEGLVRFRIAKKEATNFLNHYPSLNSVEATYANYPLLVGAIDAYHGLSDEAKSQTNVNIECLKSKLDQSFADYVRTTTEYMQNADNRLQGIPEHLPQLTKIMEWFNNIPVAVRSEISGNVIISLSMKEAHAKYLTGLTMETTAEEDVPANANVLTKLFTVISTSLDKFKSESSKWVKNKTTQLHTWATKPFEEAYPEYDDDDADDTDEADSSNENKPDNDKPENE